MNRRRFLKHIMAQASSVETGSFVVSEDIRAAYYHIAHHLGSTPDFLMVVADEFTASADYPRRYIANGYCAKANLIATNKSLNGFAAYNVSFPNNTTGWMTSEYVNITKFLHDSNFEVPYYNSGDILKAGVTYRYVVGKFE